MSDACTFTAEGIACPCLATHYVTCSPHAPNVWNVWAEPIELMPGDPEPIAEFCLRHAGDVAHQRQTHRRTAAA